jgi:protein phosphatase
MISNGSLRREAARNHPDKHVITRAVGARNKVDIDFFKETLGPEMLVLLCSDGLTNMLEDIEIGAIVVSDKDINTKAAELIKAANERGGKDNIAVVLIGDTGDPI